MEKNEATAVRGRMNSERGGQIGERRGRHGRPQTVNKATAKEKKKATQRSDESTTEEVMISGLLPRPPGTNPHAVAGSRSA